MADSALNSSMEAIKKVLDEAESLKDVLITDEKEPETEKRYIWIYSGKAERQWRTIGPQVVPMDESLEFLIRCVSIKETEVSSSRAEAMEIFENMEKALRDNITLEDTVTQHMIEKYEITPIKHDKLRGHHVVCAITAKARI